MEPRSLAYQSGTLTTTPECLLYLCEAIIELYSCLGDSVQFIEFNENMFILEKLDCPNLSCIVNVRKTFKISLLKISKYTNLGNYFGITLESSCRISNFYFLNAFGQYVRKMRKFSMVC